MKKTLSIILMLSLLLALFTGCASETMTPPATVDTTTETNPADATEETTNPDSTEPVDEPTADAETSAYPLLTDEPIALTMMKSLSHDVSGRVTDWMDSENFVWPELCRRTGVNLDFTLMIDSDYATQLALTIASEELCDITWVNSYTGGIDQCYDDGLFVCLSDHPEWIPNYMGWVNSTDANKKAAYSDGGKMMAMSQVYSRLEAGWAGYYIRQDWLNDLSLDMPTTMDDWTNVLTAFRDQKTNGVAPLDMPSGALPLSNFFSGAYNVSTSGLINDNGTVVYCWTTDGLRAYAEILRDWYANDLMDPDFATNQTWGMEAVKDRLAEDVVGAAHLIYTCSGDFYAGVGTAVEDAYFATAPWPTAAGFDRTVNFKGADSATLMNVGWMISSECEYPEIAAGLLDYCFGEEGILLTNFGIEGETFEYDENGNPQALDLIKNNEELSAVAAQHYYLIHDCFVMDLDRSEGYLSEEALKYNEYWGETGSGNLSAAISYSPEESAEMSKIKSDLDIQFNETFVKWIVGAEELNDDTWNAYLARMNEIGVDAYLEIVQIAYERWLSK